MIRAHLLRWRPRQPAQRTESTPRRLPSGAASQLDPSHRSRRFPPTGSQSDEKTHVQSHWSGRHEWSISQWEARLQTACAGRGAHGRPSARWAALDQDAGGDGLRSARPSCGQHERVVERDLAQPVVAARGAAMAGPQVGLEEQRVRVGLERAQLGHVLGRLPVHHLAVVERRPDQHRRIGAAAPGWCRGSSARM